MKIRNRKENYDYIKHLESAIYEIKQAIDTITYLSHPEVNQGKIAKLRKVIHVIDEMVNTCVFKP